MTPAKQPNTLLDLLFTVALPWAVLEYASPATSLGPFWALVVASLLPAGFGIYCWLTHSGLNFLSIFGLVAIIVTGGLGLLQLNAFWFGIKEFSVPLLLGIAFPLSHRWGKPLIAAMLFQPHLINAKAVQASLDTADKQSAYDRLLYRTSLSMGAMMVLAGVANFVLALWLIGDKAPGSEAYVQAIGTLNGGGSILLTALLLIAMMVLMMRFMRAMQHLTGLERADMMGAGRTVRRQV